MSTESDAEYVPERHVMTPEQYDRWHFGFCNGPAPCPLCDVIEVAADDSTTSPFAEAWLNCMKNHEATMTTGPCDACCDQYRPSGKLDRMAPSGYPDTTPRR